MKKYLSMIIFALALQGCSATVQEYQVGSKAPGYKSKDVCFVCGEQYIWIAPEPFGFSKEAYQSGYYTGKTDITW